MSRARGKEGLVIVATILLSLALVLDLVRSDSFILGLFDSPHQPNRADQIMRVVLPETPPRARR